MFNHGAARGSSWRGQTVTHFRRSGGTGRRIDAGNGLIFETGRLIMLVQVGLECKGLVASLALEVLESRMSLHVCPKIRTISKTFAAVGTTIGFIATVRPHVALQEPGPGKGFSTYVAFVAQVVSQDVHGQGGHGDIHLTANMAFLGTVGIKTTVRLLVPRQI